jgi:hypothetical protein
MILPHAGTGIRTRTEVAPGLGTRAGLASGFAWTERGFASKLRGSGRLGFTALLGPGLLTMWLIQAIPARMKLVAGTD